MISQYISTALDIFDGVYGVSAQALALIGISVPVLVGTYAVISVVYNSVVKMFL